MRFALGQPMEHERRHKLRRHAYVAVSIEGGGDESWIALTKNVSRSGALLMTQAKLPAGERVWLEVLYPEGNSERLEGTIVRRDPFPEHSLWTQCLAVEFASPLVARDEPLFDDTGEVEISRHSSSP